MDYVDINPKLTLHCEKKEANQKMAGSLMGLLQHIFRAGFAMQHAHTVFDYVCGTPSDDQQASRVLSEWETMLQGHFFGGIPPLMSDMMVQKEKVALFVERLFSKHTNVSMKMKVRAWQLNQIGCLVIYVLMN